MFENLFNGSMAIPAKDTLRFTMNGKIAVKVPGHNVYKTYDVDSGRLTNCTNFLFPANFNECFFVFPTNHVRKGDLIIVNGKPRCVISTTKTTITAFNFESGNIETFPPEHNVFMGNTYFYGKIVSPIGNMMLGNGKKKGMSNILKIAMMSQMFNSNSPSDNAFGGDMRSLMMMSMFSGGNNMFSDMFDGMFDECDDDEFDLSDCFDDVPTEKIEKKYPKNKKTVMVEEENSEDDE